MASEMGCKAGIMLLWFLLLGVVNATVDLSGVWLPNLGWELTCSWRTLINDTLLSVTLIRNDQQFMIYRPQTHGLRHAIEWPTADFSLKAECRIPVPQGQRGKCVISMNPFKIPGRDTYGCEVSGEGPTFRTERNDFMPFLTPSDAEIKQVFREGSPARQILYCSSSGLPAPITLEWTVDGQKVPADFSNTVWNHTTKLFDARSSYNPQSDALVAVTCTPAITKEDGQLVTGKPYTVNAAVRFGATQIFIALLAVWALLG